MPRVEASALAVPRAESQGRLRQRGIVHGHRIHGPAHLPQRNAVPLPVLRRSNRVLEPPTGHAHHKHTGQAASATRLCLVRIAEFNEEHVLPELNLRALRGEKVDRSPYTCHATGIASEGLLQLEDD